MLSPRSLATGKEAGARTPQLAMDPPHPTIPSPAYPAVGDNAPKTPPPDGVTPDEQSVLTQLVLNRLDAPIAKLTNIIATFADLLREQRDRDLPDTDLITLVATAGVGTPYKLKTNKRPYNAIIVGGSAGQTLSIQWPGQDAYTKTLVVGWNVLNVPHGTIITPSATVNVVLIRSYTFLGNPL